MCVCWLLLLYSENIGNALPTYHFIVSRRREPKKNFRTAHFEENVNSLPSSGFFQEMEKKITGIILIPDDTALCMFS